jgi:hypothetical protein
MKQALEALDSDDPSIQLRAAVALRQAIEQAEKQEPVAWYGDADGFPVYAAPVHASDISAKRVDETAKGKHEWVGLTKTEFEETVDGLEDLIDCWRALEAKLKEKNCPSAD